ncbi:amino acid permease [Candidatus Woesearchaeota archaeon]|nr:amino acid permease [Candidatus Woesearchaeota archaeon]
MSELKKSFGFGTIIALTITSMVGTGMFFGTAVGAKYSGNAVLIAWVLLVALSLYVAACFGELIALFPTAGGVYEFSKQAYGVFVSFIIGWITWLMSSVAMTVLTIAALDYVLPPGFDMSLRLGIAIGILLLLNFIAFLGVDISGAILTLFAIETIVLFLAIIVPGFPRISYANFTGILSKPIEMIFVSLFFMVEALMGWESASFLAEETKDASKVIPKALLITTLLGGLLGIGVAFVSLGIIPWQTLVNLNAPINDVALMVLGSKGAQLISWGIVLALLGSVTGTVISTPRLLLAMARDKVFVSQLAAIHPTRKTPHKAILFQAVVSILLLVLTVGKYEFLLAIFTPLALIMYAAILLAVPILRFKMHGVKRDFKVPFGLVGPTLIALLYAGIITAWVFFTPGAWPVFKIVLSLIGAGIPMFLLMISFYNPDAIAGFMNAFARINLWFEMFLLPRSVRKEMLSFIKEPGGKVVLEYGAGVGTLTLHIADAVGPSGRVYATDLSHSNVHLLKKRLAKRGLDNVVVIHDEHHASRIHPDIRNADVILSVGVLSYIQDVKKVLCQMGKIMPESGQICLVEYVNFFKFLPDKEWLSSEEGLKKLFREAGFSVSIKKKKGLLWNYLFILGIKSDQDIPII